MRVWRESGGWRQESRRGGMIFANLFSFSFLFLFLFPKMKMERCERWCDACPHTRLLVPYWWFLERQLLAGFKGRGLAREKGRAVWTI